MAIDEQFAGARNSLKPTRIRWIIMSWLTLVLMLTYLDRLNLSIAGKFIQDEFSFSTQTMGWVFSAFILGYSVFQIPGGWAADRFGARNLLTAAIVWWSAFTALTGLAPNLILVRWVGVAGSLIIVRFLVGVGESSGAPSVNKIVASWMGYKDRATGTSFVLLGIGLSGAFTPFLMSWIMQRWGWRMSFVLCGLAGLVVALAFRLYVTDRPEQNSRVNAAELALIRSTQTAQSDLPATGVSNKPRPAPWGKMLASPSVWALLIGYFCQGYPIYIFHTWFFIYLTRVRGLTISQGGIWGATPYLAIAVLAPLGGKFSDAAVRRLGKRRGRQLAVWVGMLASAGFLWFGSGATNKYLAITLLAAGGGFNMFAAASFWAACIDMTQKFTASLSGLMNTFGNLGGWVSPILTAYIATHFGWNIALDFAALISIGSAAAWLFMDASQSFDTNPS